MMCLMYVTGFNIVGGASTTSGITVYNSGEDCDLSNLSTIRTIFLAWPYQILMALHFHMVF